VIYQIKYLLTNENILLHIDFKNNVVNHNFILQLFYLLFHYCEFRCKLFRNVFSTKEMLKQFRESVN